VFVIIVLVGLFVYCVAGMTFMRVQKQASGLAMIPNQGFWAAIPGLVKDGCKYSWYKLRGLCQGRAGSGGGGTGGFQAI